MKVCFHIHSQYSKDSFLNLEKIVDFAKKNKIDVVILSDHNNLAPEKEIKKFKEIRIIPGEEIKTNQGEIIGIFLKEKIPAGLSLEETVKKIKEQKGLVVIPHPFDCLRRNRLKKSSLFKIVNQIDIIEVFNALNLFNSANKKAEEFAQKEKKIKIVGSDAHLLKEINKAIIEMDNFSDQFDFLEKLKKAKFYIKRPNLLFFIFSTLMKGLKKLLT